MSIFKEMCNHEQQRLCLPELADDVWTCGLAQGRKQQYSDDVGQPAGSPLLNAPLKSMRPASCSAMKASVRTYLFL